jgi:hypothetical protein
MTFFACYLIGIESMQWLTGFMQHIVGDINNIIDGRKANRLEPVFNQAEILLP